MAADGVEQEMVRADGDQLLEALANLLGRAVHTRGVGPGGVVVDHAEPAVKLGPGDVGALVD